MVEMESTSPSSCEICGRLAPRISIPISVGQPEEPLPDEALRLEGSKGLRRCPICGSFYRHEEEYDPHHYMGMGDEILWRIDTSEALAWLAGAHQPEFEAWRRDSGYQAWIEEIADRVRAKQADAAEANSLARHHVRLGAWVEVVALLAAGGPIRSGTLGAVNWSRAKPPADLRDLFVGLLDDPASAQQAFEILKRSLAKNEVTPVIGALTDRLDHKDKQVRGIAAFLVQLTLSPPSSYEPGGDPATNYRHGDSPRLGEELAGHLVSRFPLIVRHLHKPRSAPDPTRIAYPFDPTTGRASEMLRDALGQESDEVAHQLWEALSADRRAKKETGFFGTFENWVRFRRAR